VIRLLAIALALPLSAWSADFPLRLALPADFKDVTAAVSAGQPPPDTVRIYCNAADAQLQRAKLFGQRLYENMEKGCLVVEPDAATSYDAASGRFSIEKEISGPNMNFSSPGTSTTPRLELKTFGAAKREVKGMPTLSLSQVATSEYGVERFQFLYVATPGGVWLARFLEGRDPKRSAGIWRAFVNGL
jgi:hypothetical protein